MTLARLFGAFFDLLLLPLRLLLRQKRQARAGSFVTLDVDGKIVDLVAPRRLLQRPSRAVSVADVADLATYVSSDARVRGVIVTVRQVTSGLASVTSLRDQLARIRAAGKEVVVCLPVGGATKEVLLASIGTRVVVGPAALLAPMGFIVQSRYMRKALDRAGVSADVFACGEFKSAGETLVRDEMSEAQRTQLSELLDGFDEALVTALAEGRGVEPVRARAMVDGGPFTGSEAVRAGLATDVAHDDEVPELLGLATASPKGRPGPAPARGLLTAASYLRAKRRPLVRSIVRPPIIAVLPVHGAIAHADGPFGNLSTDERVAKMARAARLDPSVVGVVLHVDSPGGSSLASSRMHHELARLAAEKPTVACFANVAASGGYYVGVAARKIVAEPTTSTGSIGVVAVRLGATELLSRLGVSTSVVRRGERVGLLASSLPLSNDERGALARELDVTYEAFLEVVAEGRARPKTEIEPLARGRVYTGKHAHAVGLVDLLGGFDVALREVRALLPPAHARAEPVLLRAHRARAPLLAPPRAEGARGALAALLGLLPAADGALLELALAAGGERVLAFSPEAAAAADDRRAWHAWR